MKKEMRILIIPLDVHASFDFKSIDPRTHNWLKQVRHKPCSKTRLNKNNNKGRNGKHGC